MSKFSFFVGGINKIIPKENIALKELIDRIKSNKYKYQINEIRNCKDKDLQRELKNKLDYCIPSGVFTTRANEIVLKDKMQSASGILSLDVDEYHGDYTKLKDYIRKDEYVLAIFDSPREKLKIFINVPPEQDNDLFWRRWVAACKFFGNRWSCEFDELKDITRACFVSWDPNAYCNTNAKLFEEIADKEIFDEKIKSVDYSALTKGIEKGNRNEALFSLGCSLMHKKVEPAYIEVLLKEANKKNNPPMSDYELQQIFKNIFKYKKEIKKEKTVLPYVQLPQENKVIITAFIKDVAELLKDTNTFYRIADNAIVEIINNKLVLITPARLVSLIENVCVPCIQIYNRYTKSEELHKKSASEQTCKILLASPIFHNELRQIEKILTVPIPIFNDKLTFPIPGYNNNLKLYLNEDAPKLTKPNMELDEAKKILCDMLKEFCFKDDEDGVKALMALLTPYLRGLYNDWNTRTPLFVYFGNRERAGKDYLGTLRIIVFEGLAIEDAPVSTGKRDSGGNEELRKKILSTLMEGKQFMHFSNNKGFINNSILEQIITAKVWGDRVLGGNKTATFSNTLELSLSGNIGTTLTGDLSYRSVIINLFLQIEDANKRKFERPNLHHEIENNRGLILSALYSLVKNWYDNGMKKSEVVFASFPEWAGVCGGILENAGFDNPLTKSDDSNINIDREHSDMKQLFEYVYERMADSWMTKKEIRNMVMNDDDFNLSVFSYFDLNERSGQIKFAMLLDKYKGRELSGILMSIDETIKTKHKQKLKFSSVDNKVKQINLNEVFGVG